MRQLLLATRNKGKLAELRAGLESLPLEFVDLSSFPRLPEFQEGTVSFEENARRKAEHYYNLTRLMTLADDSGLIVDQLGGLPGVESARFAGKGATDEENIRKLLSMLKGVPRKRRAARFVCSLVLFDEGREIFAVEGVCEGIILEQKRGRGGFGYDPIFYVPSLGKTFAELSPEEKLALSHRGKALREARAELAAYLALKGGREGETMR